jgi:hypothetical protein
VNAQISGFKEWRDGSGFPILVIHQSHPDNDPAEQDKNLEAVQFIEKALSDCVGEAYGKKLCTTQKGSGQNGLFVIDLSAILTMFKAIKENSSKRSAAKGWIRNWVKDRIKPEWLIAVKKPSKRYKEYTCRCGMVFKSKSSSRKSKSKWLRHQKRCAYLKDLEKTLFARGKRLMEKENEERKESSHKRKTRKTKGSQDRRSVHRNKTVDSRTKDRRSKRHHHKTREGKE